MTFGDSWLGMSKNTEKIRFFWFGEVHSWVFGCFCENGLDIQICPDVI